MVKHVIKYEYIDGNKLLKPIFWCGEESPASDWHFLDAQHVALAVGGSNQPCKKCIKSIIKELEKEI